MALTEKQQSLLEELKDLQLALRAETYEKYKRINPFNEDLCDWRERGAFWTTQKNVTIYNSATLVGDIEIGENTWIGSFVSLDGTGGLKIGEHCSISSGCQIVSHDSVAWALSRGKVPYEYAPISIGNCCFIGTKAIITKGVTLGDHTLVAAGAVVTKSFPNHSIIAGIPAKKIGHVKIMDDGQVRFIYDKE